MKVLHICNDYAGSKVHMNLIKALSKRGVFQTVYCPVRSASQIGQNQFDSEDVDFYYPYIIRPWYKFVYHIKLAKLYYNLKKSINLQDYNLIHASTLFSDGGLAYKVYKEYGIPYIVAVRNTDFNVFIRVLRHTYPMGHRILRHAKKIVFISSAILRQFEKSSFVKPILHEIKDKIELRPNGIDSYWLEHISQRTKSGHKVLYIGNFSPGKNVVRLIRSVLLVREQQRYKDCHLTIVGGGGNSTDEVEKLINRHPDAISFLGKIDDKDRLASVMRDNDLFAMPSIHETFGLVYLEALSQSLPVVYTKGQGIDGMFDDSIGIAVNPLSINDIKNALMTIMDAPSKFGNSCIDFQAFSWDRIADDYYRQYMSILKN